MYFYLDSHRRVCGARICRLVFERPLRNPIGTARMSGPVYIGKKGITMRRRTFLQTLPMAAVGSAAGAQSQATGTGQSGSVASTTPDLPKFQGPGAAGSEMRADAVALAN